ncbi:arginyl-tRNA synthetase [Streptomyces sp. PLK6-54]|uniref:arginine--tRNA ligase n=2 Tax=Actinacidiphila acidipaludis TaxID=2873382 RepID=A0ABS7Q9T1_9ACTN|nr:arginyl-tRNA synthetase [Streptomyces acidipaludis]
MAEELQVEALPAKVAVQRPARPGCGDYATNVALQLAGPTGRRPLEVAAILARRLEKEPGVALVEIAGPGFLNITLSPHAFGDVVRQIRLQRDAYGRGDGLAGEAVTLTADPHRLRAPVVAETVNRLLRAAGAEPGPPEPVRVTEPEREPEPEPAQAPEQSQEPEPGPAPRPDAFGPHVLGSESLGPDATRWALLRPPAEDAPRLSADLLRQHESNPLFRVRYAHARTRALLRNAHDLGVDVDGDPDGGPEAPAPVTVLPAPGSPGSTGTPGTLTPPAPPRPSQPAPTPAPGASAPATHHPAETELLGLLADFPRVVETAARRRAPDRVARHLERLADAFLRFHDECPPLPKGDEKPSAVHAARVRLADATGIVLADGLHLLGISAPDHL